VFHSLVDFHLADLFEHAVDHFAEREYLVCDGKRRTYAQMEERANRLAHHLLSAGVGAGDHVGIYALNSVEWVETIWACFKIRAVWININYRYVEDELRYLFENADLKALLYQREYHDRVEAVRSHLPLLEHTLVFDDGSYDAALAESSPERDFAPRSADDHYILYTGGTTGMPKGVIWRHEDVFFTLGGGTDIMTGERVQRPEDVVQKGLAGNPMTSMPIAPLMHGASQWGTMSAAFTGNRVVLVPTFEAKAVWRLVEAEKVNMMMITGDAMARPLIEAFDEPGFEPDTSSLFAISSTAALFSPSVKDRFFEHFPNLILTDAIGASETGGQGVTMVKQGETAMKGGPTVKVTPGTQVLDDQWKPVAPGSGEVGKLARTGNIPLGYYKDPVKTAETFVTVDGVRWSMPGDFATVEADGTVTLLGRGSQSINSGGEKIYPEEVETAVKSHPDVYDAVVVGVPDERWGSRVACVVQPRPGATPTLESIQAHCRTVIAGYKVPRQLELVDAVVRSPSGKPDYRWAKSVAAPD
jgi:acyl-CoA synthetase (AMP-forming)/AMP-acid ligase II